LRDSIKIAEFLNTLFVLVFDFGTTLLQLLIGNLGRDGDKNKRQQKDRKLSTHPDRQSPNSRVANAVT
jgi:hypothetical protein